MSKIEDENDEVVTEMEVEAPAAAPKAKRKKAKLKAKTNGHAKPIVKANGKAKIKAKGKAKPRKPRVMDPTKLDQFGFRKGSIKSKAAAMYAGKKGATLSEVKEKLDSTQFNLLTELEEKGFKIDRVHIPSAGNRPVTRYRVHAK